MSCDNSLTILRNDTWNFGKDTQKLESTQIVFLRFKKTPFQKVVFL